MTEQQEAAMRQALEAFGGLIATHGGTIACVADSPEAIQARDAVTSLSQALEQPAIPQEMAETDIDIALREIAETESGLSSVDIPESFNSHLDRIRLDVGVSPFVNLTTDMCKWVLLAHKRAMLNAAPTPPQPAIKQSLTVEQPAQQEPVAWIVEFDDGHVETTTRPVSDWKRGMWESAGKRFAVKPLYTRPQASDWVGLTDEDIGRCFDAADGSMGSLITAIEAKLKEKNA